MWRARLIHSFRPPYSAVVEQLSETMQRMRTTRILAPLIHTQTTTRILSGTAVAAVLVAANGEMQRNPINDAPTLKSEVLPDRSTNRLRRLREPVIRQHEKSTVGNRIPFRCLVQIRGRLLSVLFVRGEFLDWNTGFFGKLEGATE